MILFCNKKTKEVVGTVEGRVHTKGVLDNFWIQPKGTDKNDIVKYVVPFKPVKSIVTIRGKKAAINELLPDVGFADLILKFDSREEKISDYFVELNKNGEIVGFEKK